MSSVEEIRNATLAYLVENYPQSVNTIPEDVLQFGMPDRVCALLFGAVMTLSMIISLTGNSIMFYLYSRFKTLRTPSNMLVINLAIANFVMHGKNWVLIVNSIDGGPLLGDLGKCKKIINVF